MTSDERQTALALMFGRTEWVEWSNGMGWYLRKDRYGTTTLGVVNMVEVAPGRIDSAVRWTAEWCHARGQTTRVDGLDSKETAMDATVDGVLEAGPGVYP